MINEELVIVIEIFCKSLLFRNKMVENMGFFVGGVLFRIWWC